MSDESNLTTPPAAESPDSRGSGTRRWFILALVVLLVLYLTSPYYAFWRFTVALRSADAVQLERAVDFPSVRKSMRKQLNASIAALRPQNPKRQKMFDAVSGALGSSVIDSLLDAYLTPEGLAAFLADPKLPDGIRPYGAPPPAGGAPPTTAPPMIDQQIDWSRVRYAFFTGPRDFLVDVEGTKLRFRFNGLRWRLRELELDVSKLKL